MRRILIASTAALALTASVAQAGGVKETMVKPVEVVKAASSSGGGLIVPLLILVVLVALLSNSSGGAAILAD